MMYATQSARAHHRQRVLCVDDNPFSLFVSTVVFRNQGYQVLACSDSLQAASISQSEELDLAVLDYEMPDMNGAELAAFCKAVNPDIKVIVFSGSMRIPSRELAFADLFVQKPDGVEGLLEAMEAVLAGEKVRSSIPANYDICETTN